MSITPFFKKRSVILLTLVTAMVAVGVCCYFYFTSTPAIEHVILISMDTTRADHLSCYGYSQKTTPHIDAISQEGFLFKNAISPVPLTLPSHSSMLTGTLPLYHGVLDNHGYTLAKDNVTLAEILKDNGFRTAGFVSSFVLDSQFGMDQGFDNYDDQFNNTQNTRGINERRGDETTRHAIQWLEEQRGEKNFIFLHYFDPHYPYSPSEPFASTFKQSPKNEWVTEEDAPRFAGYPGEIAFVDHCIGQVLEKLKELDIYDSSLIIITGDHGESLGEHKERTHDYFIYQSTVHVPLIIKMPDSSKLQTVKEAVSLVDIVPTVCSLLGIQLPADIQGKDLTPYLSGQQDVYPDRYVFSQSLKPTAYLANSLLGVVGERYKYIQTTRPELYDLIADPHESHNLYPTESQRARIMEDALQQIMEESTRTDNLDATSENQLDQTTRKRLEALGYVGGAVNTDFIFDQSKEDPKDMIDYHTVYTTMNKLVHEKKLAEAYEVCNQLIAMKPGFSLPYTDRARILIEEKKYNQAIVNLKKALELNPDYITANQELAYIYKTQGNTDPAIKLYIKMLKLEPDNVAFYFHLADLLYEQGRYAETDDYLSPTLTENPSYADIATVLGNKLLEDHQFKLAYSHYLRILKIKPDSTDVLNTLAWLEGASSIQGIRNPPLALEHALKAYELMDEKQASVLDTLAVAYAANGNFDMAETTVKKAMTLAMQDNKTALTHEFQTRLRLYQSEKMFFDAGLK